MSLEKIVKDNVKKINPKYYNPMLWFEAKAIDKESKANARASRRFAKLESKRLIKEYRSECYNVLRTEYGWPKIISKGVAKIVTPSKGEANIGDYVAGFLSGGIPSRYIDAVAKLRNIDKTVYTKGNIAADIMFFGLFASAFTAANYYAKDIDIPSHAKPIYDLVGKKVFPIMLILNNIPKLVQIPYRIHHVKKGNHKPAYTSLFHPLILPGVIFGYFLGYDIYKSVKERRLENKSKMYTYFGINTHKNNISQKSNNLHLPGNN